MATNLSVQESFLQQLGAPLQLERLLEGLPDTYFFAKNARGQFVLCNSATLAALRLESESDLIGKTDYDIVPAEFADQYRQADQMVMESARPVQNIIEPVPDSNGVLTWYVTNKVPLFGNDDRVVGVAGAMRDFESVGTVLGPYQEMSVVIDYMFRHCHEPIAIEDLARIVDLSVRQFERRFKKLFGLTPLRYINQLRLRNACTRLRRTRDSISIIAHAIGFYDHAHFVHQFKDFMKMTPTEYRKMHQEAYQTIREKLMSGEYPPGSLLSDDSTFREMGVDRNPIREAINQFVSEGLIEYRPRYGAYVKSLSADELDELWGVRIALESFAACEAADSATNEDLDALVSLNKEILELAKSCRDLPGQMASHDLMSEFLSLDAEFHQRMLKAAGNQHLVKTVRDYRMMTHIFGPKHIKAHASADILIKSQRDHELIIDAIRNSNRDNARDCTADHIQSSRQRVLGK